MESCFFFLSMKPIERHSQESTKKLSYFYTMMHKVSKVSSKDRNLLLKVFSIYGGQDILETRKEIIYII